MNAIEVKNLTKIYRLYQSPRDRIREIFNIKGEKYHQEFYALKDVSFNVKKGQTVGIIGQNGSGKSTLLKIISGVVTATSGDVKTEGRIASLLELGAGFNPEFTGRENVYMNGALMGLSREKIDRRFGDIAYFADIGEFIDQPVKNYSSGMYIRLAFASAIHVDPDILIIDEALAVGDAMFQLRCWDKIGEFKKMKTILFVSHNMNAIVIFCDEVIWLKGGQIVEINEPKVASENYLAYLYNLNNSYMKRSHQAAEDNSAADQKRFGNNSVKIISMDITDHEGQELKVLGAGTQVKVSIHVECLDEVKSPIIGFTVRNLMGVVIFLTNTNYEKIVLPGLNRGSKLDVNFIFSWPAVADGNYSFSPAFADGTQESHVMCDWIHDHIILESNSSDKVIGLIRLDEMDVSYNVF